MTAVDVGASVRLIDVRGVKRDVMLTKQIGRGGEGAVYLTDDQTTAVKVFLPEKCAAKFPKVQAMLRVDPEPNSQDRHIAWPHAVAYTSNSPVGYAMPLVRGRQLIHATAPDLRRKLDTDLDLFAFCWLAENIAKAVAKLHDRGHVIGDFKVENAMFDPEHLDVYLIDTDSFGIDTGAGPRIPPDAFTPDWSPPEFNDGRTKDVGIPHDLFSLAVFYHKLIFTIHPFSGQTRTTKDVSAVEAMIAGDWLYKNNNSPNGIDPPFTIVGPGLQALFRRAFVDGHTDPGKRPTTREWAAGFSDARYDLEWCSRRSLHVFDHGHAATAFRRTCPWCDLKHDRWKTDRTPTGLTRSIALRELQGWVSPTGVTKVAFERAKRRLAANPTFAREVPEVVQRLERHERHLAEIKRQLDHLRSVQSDDVELMKAAGAFAPGSELEAAARDDGLASVLVTARTLVTARQKLDAAVAAAQPDARGRVTLAGERTLLAAVEVEEKALGGRTGLIGTVAARRAQAIERLQAYELVVTTLAGRRASPAPIDDLRAVLSAQSSRLRELADDGVNGPDGVVRLADAIVELDRIVALPATDVPDEDVLAAWDRLVSTQRAKSGIVDAPRRGRLSLAAEIAHIRESVAAIQVFEADWRQILASGKTAAELDRALMAADPSPRLWPRSMDRFNGSPAGQALAAARCHVELAARIEAAARLDDADTRDPALAEEWGRITDTTRLGLSPETRARVTAAVARMDRLGELKPLALAMPPDDRALLEAMSTAPDTADLMGLPLSNGLTLGARVLRAKERVARASAVEQALREDGCAGEAHERAVLSAWAVAETARREAPALFASMTTRVDLADNRIRMLDALRQAIAEGMGRAIREHWSVAAPLASAFAPLADLRGDIERLDADYDAYLLLVQGAIAAHVAQSADADAHFLRQLASKRHALKLADAREVLPALGNRSLQKFVATVEVRERLERELETIQGYALDGLPWRRLLAKIADETELDAALRLPPGPVVADLCAAIQAKGATPRVQGALDRQHLLDLLDAWDETWHPFLSATQVLVPAASALAKARLPDLVPSCDATRLSDDRIKITWTWPAADRLSARETGLFVAFALGNRRPPQSPDDTDDHVTVFHGPSGSFGSIELPFLGDHFAALAQIGCIIGGQPIVSTTTVPVAEPKRRVSYRFEPGGRMELDRVTLQSASQFSRQIVLPRLKLIHELDPQHVVAMLPSVVVGPGDAAASVPIQRPGHAAPVENWLTRFFHRMQRGDRYRYRLEVPTDEEDWLELDEMSADYRYLSFTMAKPGAAGSGAQ